MVLSARGRDLCDAAIGVLADEGTKGLSHIKVDRRAGVADGTTSVYFRTRKALVNAIAARVAELDRDDFAAAMETSPGDTEPVDPILPVLAGLIMKAAQEPSLSRTRARYELLMQANRDPTLRQYFEDMVGGFAAMSRVAVRQLLPEGEAADEELVEDQAFAITTFINGLLVEHVFGGDRTIQSAEKLTLYLHAVLDGVAAQHKQRRRDGEHEC